LTNKRAKLFAFFPLPCWLAIPNQQQRIFNLNRQFGITRRDSIGANSAIPKDLSGMIVAPSFSVDFDS
jgi:hypothetical protein